MYEQFRNEVMTNLSSVFNEQDVSSILHIVDAVAASYDVTPKSMDIIPYFQDMPEMCKMYLVSRSIEGLSPKTLTLYQNTLKHFFQMVRKAPQDVVTNDVRVWLFCYQQERDIQNRTMELYREIISSFFGWATSCEYIPKNPCLQIKHIKYSRKPRKAMCQMDLEYIRDACETIKETAIIEFMYSTGCRVSEMTALKKDDIDWEKKEVQLFGKGSKYRTSYLNVKAVVALRKYLMSRTDDSEYVFVTTRAPHHPIGKSGLERIVRNIFERTNGKVSVPITPHVFRHTTVTVALQNGMPVQDVQRMLGHANINTTMVYAEVSQAEVKTMHTRCVV